MISTWWLLVAFILGGYVGAILVGLMSMAARADEDMLEAPMPRKPRAEHRRGRAAVAHAH